MNRRLAKVALAVVSTSAASSQAYTPLGAPEQAFISNYTTLVLVETGALLMVLALVVPWLARRVDGPLLREVKLGTPGRVVAAVAFVAGLFLFAFWAGLDVLSRYYSFPAWILTYNSTAAEIYNGLGLGLLPIPDKYHVIGVFGLLLAVVAFVALRLGGGVGNALRDGLAYVAAPCVLLFELGLWAEAPAEMYWHATYFTPWSIGKFLTASQFETINRTGDLFLWAGNMYVVSNWFALTAACSVLGTAIVFAMHRRSRAEALMAAEPPPGT